VTNPPQGGDPAQWARPTESFPAQPTESFPARPTHTYPPPPPHATERIPRQQPQPTEQLPRQGQPDPATDYIPRASSPMDAPTDAAAPRYAPPPVPPSKESKLRRFVKDPLSIILVLVIVIALGIAALLGGELYARHRANAIVAKVVACVVQDEATASFGVVPPFLWQHVTGHYTNINIETAGNQIREAKGMKVDIDIKDVRLQDTGDSGGTIGSLVAKIDWSSDGIKQTVQGAIPLFGGIVSGVQTRPSDGTIELQGPLGSVIAKPEVVDNGLSLQVLSVSGLGFTLPRETVQPALDVFTAQLTKNYPMGIHADSVEVTDTGVSSQFSTTNATIPPPTEDPCFASL
jgi:type IV secretory pathway VirB2 component (pilin)